MPSHTWLAECSNIAGKQKPKTIEWYRILIFWFVSTSFLKFHMNKNTTGKLQEIMNFLRLKKKSFYMFNLSFVQTFSLLHCFIFSLQIQKYVLIQAGKSSYMIAHRKLATFNSGQFFKWSICFSTATFIFLNVNAKNITILY